ncbi:MAG: carboxypeptidase-like regulatory domain-containing protein [Spirochaetia bacterium]|nr:carboxypeptidase-like regulatory domain-containing protein [Spirochaetia bacterium]
MKKLFIYLTLTLFLQRFIYAQNPQNSKIKISGIVYSEVTSKPQEFATIVILELKIKTKTDEDGKYNIEIPKPGNYTFIVTTEGLKPLQENLEISSDLIHDFTIGAIHVEGRSLTVRGTRDIQQVSRNTMTSKEIKSVPAGFNDIIRSLTSMPGITSRGIFGSIIMRGANPSGNFYTIDNIPIMDPRHFLGLHTIISSDAISQVDVFSSAFPAQYGFANAAVISMNTLDEVKKIGGVVDIGLISANAIVKGPIQSTVDGKTENKGYWFLSGRAGYISLLFPLFNEVIKSPISQLPEYYDYQAKVKYYFNSKHAIKVFVMGTNDTFIFNPSPKAQAELFKQRAGGDPLSPLTGINARYSLYTHNQAIYYEFQPGDLFLNTVMLFSSLNRQNYEMIMTYGSGSADISKNTIPNVFGIRDDMELKWMDNQNALRLGLEYYYFDFKSTGVDIIPLKPPTFGSNQPPNFSDPTQYELRPYKKEAQNQIVGGYLENKFKWNGLVFVPGFRFDYLKLNKEIIWDPRGLISYEFNTGTLLSLAGGKYSQFMQSNMNYFDNSPVVAVTPNYTSEKALHSVFGIEQKIKEYSVKGEIYYNYFYNSAYRYNSPDQVDPSGAHLTYINSGISHNYGFEILLRKLGSENNQGLFGWISYTFTQAKLRTGVPDQPYKDIFINSQREEAHSIKTVTGYRIGFHTISGKIAFNTSFPYTKITGDDGDPFKMGRYAPVYSSTPNTGWYDPVITVDLRYSYAKPYKWGEITYYIEVINVLGAIYKRRDSLRWRYDQPYQAGVNPTLTSSDQVLPFIPNFGVEIKF